MRDALSGRDLALGKMHILRQFGPLDKGLVGVNREQNRGAPSVLCEHERTLRGLHLLDEAGHAGAELRQGVTRGTRSVETAPRRLNGPISAQETARA